MTDDEVMAFLAKHQPLGSDETLSQEAIHTLVHVREHVLAQPSERFLPLLLNVFGDGDGFGVYQLFDDVFAKYHPTVVVPLLARSLRSPHRSVRFWSVHWALLYPDAALTDSLSSLVGSEVDEDAHYLALSALETIFDAVRDDRILEVFRTRRALTGDAELHALIDEFLRRTGS